MAKKKGDYILLPVVPASELFKTLTDEEIGIIFSALMEKCFKGIEPDLDDSLKEPFSRIFYCAMEQTNHPRRRNWEEGAAAKAKRDRNSAEYAEWRTTVFVRDGFRCQICGNVGGRLNAHHIEFFSKCVEKRFDPDNGITLCEKCHRAVHRGEIKCRTGS